MKRISRRRFVAAAGATTAVLTIVPRAAVAGSRQIPPNEKINIAGIGVGGQGWSDIRNWTKENIVAVCDVDERKAAEAVKLFKCPLYRDGRKMLDELDNKIDAVLVATPDHTHAVHVVNALKHDKHVYCEKPLAHSIGEVRAMMKAAREHKVVTQLGNQGHSSGDIRKFVTWIQEGVIGNVAEIHAGVDAFPGLYSQIDKLPKLSEKHDVPKELEWDLWLGPTKQRDYNPLFAPWNWRGWSQFGTGAIGDWFCHVVDPVFWAFDLGAPETITAETEDWDPKAHAETFPGGSAVTFQFAAKGQRGPVKLVWFDGKKKIPRAKDLEPDRKPPGTGAVVLGDKGTISYGSHGAGGVRLVPDAKMREFKQPEVKIPPVKGGHHQDWTDAIREGRPAGSNFDYGGALTEIALLGAIAQRFPNETLRWDAAGMKFTNHEAANQYINPPYREGWSL